MRDYLHSAVQMYQDTTGEKLTPVTTPFAVDISNEQVGTNWNVPGKYGVHAASLLMKLMYPARMAYPQLQVPVSRLAREITRWSIEAARRIQRFFA